LNNATSASVFSVTADGKVDTIDGNILPSYSEASTGVITGGHLDLVGAPGASPSFTITAGKGLITDPSTGVVTEVSWPGQTITPSPNPVYTGILTWVHVNAAGVLTYSDNPPSDADDRSEIDIGVLVHTAVPPVNLDAVNNEQAVVTFPANQLRDLMNALGFINIEGNLPSSPGGLKISKSEGKILAHGSNHDQNELDPHRLTLAAIDTTIGTGINVFQYRFQDGTSGPLTDVDFDFDLRDTGTFPGGTIGTQKWGLAYVFSFTSNALKIQPTQGEYNSVELAEADIGSASFTIEPSIKANGLLIGYIVHRGGGTDLTDPNDALFLSAGKFGAGTGGGVLGGTQNLQSTYDNSPAQPQITVNDTNLSLVLANDQTLDTSTVLEVKDISTATTFSVTGAGEVYAGNLTTTEDIVHIGSGAGGGVTPQATDTVAIGTDAGSTGQLGSSVAIGFNAGKINQQASAVAIGDSAGGGAVGQLADSVAIGTSAGSTGQQASAIAIGWEAGKTNQQGSSVSIGTFAGVTTQGLASVAMGNFAGNDNQDSFAVAIGYSAGRFAQGSSSVAIGNAAGGGAVGQLANSVAIGTSAGSTDQQASAIAIGFQAGLTSQGADCIAIGTNTITTGVESIAMGLNASTVAFNDSIAIGTNATSTAGRELMIGGSGTTENITTIVSGETNTCDLGTETHKFKDSHLEGVFRMGGSFAVPNFYIQNTSPTQTNISALGNIVCNTTGNDTQFGCDTFTVNGTGNTTITAPKIYGIQSAGIVDGNQLTTKTYVDSVAGGGLTNDNMAVNGNQGSITSALIGVSNRVYAIKFIPEHDVTVTSVGVFVTSGGVTETVNIGLYNSSNTLLQSATTSALSAGFTGIKTVAITSQALTGGTEYIFAIQGSGSSTQFGISSTITATSCALQQDPGAGLPATLAGAAITQAIKGWIYA
jgi:hypothetical protein